MGVNAMTCHAGTKGGRSGRIRWCVRVRACGLCSCDKYCRLLGVGVSWGQAALWLPPIRSGACLRHALACLPGAAPIFAILASARHAADRLNLPNIVPRAVGGVEMLGGGLSDQTEFAGARVELWESPQDDLGRLA